MRLAKPRAAGGAPCRQALTAGRASCHSAGDPRVLCSAKLTGDQVAYCLKHMKPIPNQPGHYDYKEFAETVRARALALPD